jgi:RimJ/RimL family protein N-acetyltransferase
MADLDTPRLLLRLPEERDLDAFVEIHEDPEVLQYLHTMGDAAGRAAGWRTLAMILGHWQLRGFGQWTVVERSTGDVIGRVGLWSPEGRPAVELGWLIRRSHWNRGFATEAGLAAIDFGFGRCRLTHLTSSIRSDNHRSIRVAEKLGQSLERREPADEGGETLVYGIRKG